MGAIWESIAKSLSKAQKSKNAAAKAKTKAKAATVKKSAPALSAKYKQDITPVASDRPSVPVPTGYVAFHAVMADCDSVINDVDTFVAVDVETTGLDRLFDKIVEIGIAEYSGGALVSEFTTLINPQRPISAEASAVSGITDQDLVGAPTYPEIAQQVADRLRGKMLIAHNARFDTAFIQRLLSYAEISDVIYYIDTLDYARYTVDGVPDYKLDTLVAHYGIGRERGHRALDDAKAAAEVFLRARAEYPETLRRRAEAAKIAYEQEKQAQKENRTAKAKEHEEKFHDSPLYNVVFAFTGEFSAPRQTVEQKALDMGAIVRGNVSRNTDYLVVGDISNLPDWAVARKSGKADELIQQGKKVKKISESVYWGIISETEGKFRRPC